MRDQEFNSTLLSLVDRAEEGAPASPHKPFVFNLVRLVHQHTGAVHAESWYRHLMAAAGSKRKPSTRTVSDVVRSVKESLGLDAGPTQVAVKKLRGQYQGLLDVVTRLESTTQRLAQLTERQLQISQAVDKRQLVFADQAQVYQRQIDQIAALVKESVASSREVTRNSNDVALNASRVIRDLQALLAKDRM